MAVAVCAVRTVLAVLMQRGGHLKILDSPSLYKVLDFQSKEYYLYILFALIEI